MKIYLDSRGRGEKAEQYKNALKKEFPDIISKLLPIGDLVASNCCIELKTIPDFLASITDQRLRHQPIQMLQYPNPLIVVLGSFTDLFAQNLYNSVYPKTQHIHDNAILGTIASIEARFKEIPILFVEDINIVSMLNYIDPTDKYYSQYVIEWKKFAKNKTQYHYSMKLIRYFIEKANDGKPREINPMRKNPTNKDKQIQALTGFEGIERELAVRLLKEFGSVKNIVCQSPKELQKVDGIGSKKSEKLFKNFTYEYQTKI